MENVVFDFASCREWLDVRVAELKQTDNRFELVHCDKHKKSVSVIRFSGQDIVGQFSVWSSGECDYEVHKSKKMLAHEWGLSLNNDTFPAAFDRFLGELSHHRLPQST